jgi:hypothetical protein
MMLSDKPMKKVSLTLGILAIIWACASLLPKSPVTVIHAQSLPKTVTLAWDANAPSDNVTNYVVRLNGTVVGSPTGTTQLVTITTAGLHTLAVRAVNMWAESPDSTLTVNVVVPGKPTNLRLQ